jgi:hypothetical protein
MTSLNCGVDVICHRAVEPDSTRQHARTYPTEEACVDARDRFLAQHDPAHELDLKCVPDGSALSYVKNNRSGFLFEGAPLVPLVDVTRAGGQPSITRVEIPKRYSGCSVAGSRPHLLLERHAYLAMLVSSLWRSNANRSWGAGGRSIQAGRRLICQSLNLLLENP